MTTEDLCDETACDVCGDVSSNCSGHLSCEGLDDGQACIDETTTKRDHSDLCDRHADAWDKWRATHADEYDDNLARLEIGVRR